MKNWDDILFWIWTSLIILVILLSLITREDVTNTTVLCAVMVWGYKINETIKKK